MKRQEECISEKDDTPLRQKSGFFTLGWLNNRTDHEKTKTRDRFVFVENEQHLSIIPVLLADQYWFWCVNHQVCYLQGKLLWFNFFESFQHVTISFKVDSTLYHLIHITFLKSDIIRNLDELYVHFTLERNKKAQLLTKLETYNVVVSRAPLWSRSGETRPGYCFRIPSEILNPCHDHGKFKAIPWPVITPSWWVQLLSQKNERRIRFPGNRVVFFNAFLQGRLSWRVGMGKPFCRVAK